MKQMRYAQQAPSFAPNIQLCVLLVFAIGVITSFLLVIAALVAAAYILNLAMVSISELATHIAALYNESDSLVKLLLICIIGYVLAWLARSAYRSFTHGGAA
jgi:hypothetical protein